MEQYQKALKINPGLFQLHNSLAILLAQRGHFSGALSHYQQAIGPHHGFAQAHNDIGIPLAGQGRFEEAIVHFEQATNFDSHYRVAQKNLKLAALWSTKKTLGLCAIFKGVLATIRAYRKGTS